MKLMILYQTNPYIQQAFAILMCMKTEYLGGIQ